MSASDQAQIRTVADIDALPVGTILKQSVHYLDIWYRHRDGWLLITPNTGALRWVWNAGHLPVQVVWTPGDAQ